MRSCLLAALLAAAPAAGHAATLEFSSHHGGNAIDVITDAVPIVDGGVLTVGYTTSTDLPMSAGAPQTTKGPGADGFLTKISASNTRTFSRYINGAGNEYPYALTIDGAGRIFVAGQQHLDDAVQCFVMRFSASGLFEWASVFGGSGAESCYGVAVDATGRVHVVGETYSSDLATTGNPVQATYGGGGDALYTVFEPSGQNTYNQVYTTYLGAGGLQQFSDVAVANGYAYLAGSTNASGAAQAFATKLAYGGGLSWIRTIDIGNATFSAIALDTGSIYLSGTTTTAGLATTPGVFQPSFPGNPGSLTCLLARLDDNGVVQRLGYGEADTSCSDIAVSGNTVWLAGNARGAYALRTNTDFSTLAVSAAVRHADDGNPTYATAVTVRQNGDALLAGATSSSAYPNTPDAFQSNQADADGFVTQIGSGTPSLSLSDCAVAEGAPGQNFQCQITASLDRRPIGPVAFRTQTADRTATTSDYTGGSFARAIQPGQTTLSFSVGVVGDALDEPDEYGVVDLFDRSGPVFFPDTQATFTITDDDPTDTVLAIEDASLFENVQSATFNVGLRTPSGQSTVSGYAVQVDWTTANGSATAGADYTTASGTLTIPAGFPSQTLSIPTLPDTLDEPNEQFVVNFSNPRFASLPDTQGVATIIDDDDAPTLTVTAAGGGEATGQTAAFARATLTGASAAEIRVSVATVAETAAADVDYGQVATTFVFAPGESGVKQVAIPLYDDALDENDETVRVEFSGFVNVAAPANASQQIKIFDDDGSPALSVSGCTVTEGASGTRNCDFTYTLTALSGRSVYFTTYTTNVSAFWGEDYTGHSGTQREIPAGAQGLVVSVPVLGDTTDEADEVFVLVTPNVQNASPDSLPNATGAIADDDTPPVTFDDCSVGEGNAGTTTCTFHIRLVAPSPQPVTVRWAGFPNSADLPLYERFESPDTGGVATLFAPATLGRFSVASGSVDVIDSSFWQPAEGGQSIDLSGNSPGTLSAAMSTTPGVDYRVHFQLAANVGCAPTVKHMDVLWGTATLGSYTFDGTGRSNAAMGWRSEEVAYRASALTSQLTFGALDAGPCGPTLDNVIVLPDGLAVPDYDYLPASGTVTIAAGAKVSAPQTFTVIADTRVERNEVFTLFAPDRIGLAGDVRGTATIVNDDTPADAVFKNGFE